MAVRKRKLLKYKGGCLFKIWEMPNGKLRFEADLEDLKGLVEPKKKPIKNDRQ